jgi:acetolactate synthase-1/2/3 large subunit
MMMTVQELETAVRHKVPVISLVFNNQMYGTIRMHQEIHYPGKVAGTDLGSIRFAELAASLGARGKFVSTKTEFLHALKEAMTGELPTVIEIPMSREQISTGTTINQIRERHNR